MNRKQRRKVIRSVSTNLDRIYAAAKDIAKQWDMNSIPAETFKLILSKSKPAINTEFKSVNDHNKAFNKCLDSLYDSCLKVSKKIGSNKISIESIREGLKIIKEVYE